MFDEYFETPSVEPPVHPALASQVPVLSAGTPLSTTIDQDAPSTSHSPSSSEVQPPISHQGVAAGPIIEDNPFAQADNDSFENVFAPELSSAESSSEDVSSAESNQLATDALWCFYNSVLSKVKPKNFKTAVNEDCWFEAIQEEIYEFDRLQVWELVPRPDCVMIITLKWILWYFLYHNIGSILESGIMRRTLRIDLFPQCVKDKRIGYVSYQD
ncbi:hypothetical protein Tco_0992862 [Tanacetum coccineum]|uniref:Integrase, catalytic region, zinc finger, CCHC-type, peptidase aspartic, catalytic n=1 Tax=Tanacetum coccineum TaxID=301880 RepID=A0ABQ5F3B1_9ASTR